MIIRFFDIEFEAFIFSFIGRIDDKIGIVDDFFGNIEIDSHDFESDGSGNRL
jgi:hypothetical protein